MSKTCEHPVMSRAGRICGARAKQRAELSDKKFMLVCMRHAKSLAAIVGPRRARQFEDLELHPVVIADIEKLKVLRMEIVAWGIHGITDMVPYLSALDRVMAAYRRFGS